MKNLETLLKDYADHVAERAAKGIPPLPLNAEQTNCITKLLEQDSTYDSSYLLDLLIIYHLSKIFIIIVNAKSPIFIFQLNVLTLYLWYYCYMSSIFSHS